MGLLSHYRGELGIQFQRWASRFFKTPLLKTIYASTLKIPPTWLRAKHIKCGGGIYYELHDNLKGPKLVSR